MKSLAIFSFALALAGTCLAQEWEVGAGSGVGVYQNATITADGTSAQAGFKNGAIINAFFVQNMYKHVSGELGYTFQLDDLKLSSGGTEATFTGHSHSVFYALRFMGRAPEATLRPYVALGGGVKVYQGRGEEQATQELSQFAAFTHTQEVKPLVTVGAGIRLRVASRCFIYAEARDYITPFPSNVIAPIPPARVSGWLHDIVPLAGISVGF